MLGSTLNFFSIAFSAFQLAIFPALFLIARKRSWHANLQSLFLINSVLFALLAYWNFLAGFRVMDFDFYSTEPNLYPPDPNWIFWVQGSADTFTLCFLLNAAVLVLIALAAVFFEKIALLKDKAIVYCLAVSIAVLYLAGCIIMASFVVEANRSLQTYNFSEKCSSELYQRWTPEYVEQIKASEAEMVNMQLDSYVSGKFPYRNKFGHESPILDKAYFRFRLMHSALNFQKNREFRACFNGIAENTDFRPTGIGFSLFFLLTGIACLAFSRKVFTKKKYANEALEKGFLFAGMILLYYFIQYFAGHEFILLGQIAALLLASLAAYWLGWRPSFLKKKQAKEKLK